jgi:hypothetical protein
MSDKRLHPRDPLARFEREIPHQKWINIPKLSIFPTPRGRAVSKFETLSIWAPRSAFLREGLEPVRVAALALASAPGECS